MLILIKYSEYFLHWTNIYKFYSFGYFVGFKYFPHIQNNMSDETSITILSMSLNLKL